MEALNAKQVAEIVHVKSDDEAHCIMLH